MKSPLRPLSRSEIRWGNRWTDENYVQAMCDSRVYNMFVEAYHERLALISYFQFYGQGGTDFGSAGSQVINPDPTTSGNPAYGAFAGPFMIPQSDYRGCCHENMRPPGRGYGWAWLQMQVDALQSYFVRPPNCGQSGYVLATFNAGGSKNQVPVYDKRGHVTGYRDAHPLPWPNGWTRAYPKSINTLHEAPDYPGQRARLLPNGNFFGNYWQNPNNPTMREMGMSGWLFQYGLDGWKYDQAIDDADLVFTTGLAKPCDRPGPWILNDLKRALDQLYITYAIGGLGNTNAQLDLITIQWNVISNPPTLTKGTTQVRIDPSSFYDINIPYFLGVGHWLGATNKETGYQITKVLGNNLFEIDPPLREDIPENSAFFPDPNYIGDNPPMIKVVFPNLKVIVGSSITGGNAGQHFGGRINFQDFETVTVRSPTDAVVEVADKHMSLAVDRNRQNPDPFYTEYLAVNRRQSFTYNLSYGGAAIRTGPESYHRWPGVYSASDYPARICGGTFGPAFRSYAPGDPTGWYGSHPQPSYAFGQGDPEIGNKALLTDLCDPLFYNPFSEGVRRTFTYYANISTAGDDFDQLNPRTYIPSKWWKPLKITGSKGGTSWKQHLGPGDNDHDAERAAVTWDLKFMAAKPNSTWKGL